MSGAPPTANREAERGGGCSPRAPGTGQGPLAPVALGAGRWAGRGLRWEEARGGRARAGGWPTPAHRAQGFGTVSPAGSRQGGGAREPIARTGCLGRSPAAGSSPWAAPRGQEVNRPRTGRGRLQGLPSGGPYRAAPDSRVPRFSQESDGRRRAKPLSHPRPAPRAPRPYLTRTPARSHRWGPLRCHSNVSPSPRGPGEVGAALGSRRPETQAGLLPVPPSPPHPVWHPGVKGRVGSPPTLVGSAQRGGPRAAGGGGVDGRRPRLHPLSSPRADLTGRGRGQVCCENLPARCTHGVCALVRVSRDTFRRKHPRWQATGAAAGTPSPRLSVRAEEAQLPQARAPPPGGTVGPGQ